MKNRVLYTFLITLLVIVGLALLQLLPSLTVCGYTLRPVRMLADVCVSPTDTASVADTIPVVKPAFKEECPPGVTLIEDYSFTQADTTRYVGRGMAAFYEALATSRSAARPVRIAYFGDSFIEGDILTADLRSMLQSTYGGSGVGFVDIASPTAGFRQSVRAYSHGWSSHCITDTIWFDRKRQGPAERYYRARGNASVQLNGLPSRRALHQDSCDVSTLYFRTNESFGVTARINGGESEVFYPSASDEVQALSVSGRIGRVQWQVNDSTAGTTFYGVTMEGQHGVSLDNFSLRGSSGITLKSIPDATLRSFSQVRAYDLVVLQFGLNVANKKVTNYSAYQREMEQVVQKIVRCFPEASILIVSVGDRGERRDGEVVTMHGIKNLITYQRQIAYRTGCCFWNLFEAMGGEGSMARLADGTPSLANKDYTHINFKGGKHLAQLFYDALRTGKKNHDKRKAYEAN